MKLVLIRHGQTVANLKGYFAGQEDVPLTPQGEQEALAIRAVLSSIPFDKVYSSDLSRSVNTQKLALPGYTPIQTPLLREYNTGALTGKYIKEIVAEHGKVFYENFGGESNADMCARIRKFLNELEADPCDYVAAFAHNGTVKTMLQLVLNTNFARGNVISTNCGITVFEFDGEVWRLLAWNYGCSL